MKEKNCTQLNKLPDPDSTCFETLSELDMGLCLHGDWVRIPILAAGCREVAIAWFAAGLVPGENKKVHMPEWSRHVMDPVFCDAADIAGQVIRRQGLDSENRRFVLFPLAPANGKIQFTGASAALSLALGFNSLAQREAISSAVIATGGLDLSGEVRRVGRVERKALAALDCGFKCIIIPAQAQRCGKVHDSGVVPVTEFAQAWTIARGIARGLGTITQ